MFSHLPYFTGDLDLEGMSDGSPPGLRKDRPSNDQECVYIDAFYYWITVASCILGALLFLVSMFQLFRACRYYEIWRWWRWPLSTAITIAIVRVVFSCCHLIIGLNGEKSIPENSTSTILAGSVINLLFSNSNITYRIDPRMLHSYFRRFTTSHTQASPGQCFGWRQVK
jgi:hypothetical protein